MREFVLRTRRWYFRIFFWKYIEITASGGITTSASSASFQFSTSIETVTPTT